MSGVASHLNKMIKIHVILDFVGIRYSVSDGQYAFDVRFLECIINHIAIWSENYGKAQMFNHRDIGCTDSQC